MAVPATLATWGAVAIVLLSGCASPPPAAPAPTTDPDAPRVPTSTMPFASPPVWVEGQWWTYEITSDGEPAERDTRIVTLVDGPTYIMDTTSRDAAAFDAEFDVSSLGPISAVDLSGWQEDHPVTYFQWPLAEGKEWRTTWDGVERTVRAVGVRGDAFDLEAHEDGRLRVRYSFDAASGFFGHMDFLDDEGEVTYGMRLVDHGAGYQGPYVRALVTVHLDQAGAGIGSTSVTTFELPSGVTELVVRYAVACPDPGGAWAIEVSSFNVAVAASGGHRDAALCPDERVVDLAVPEPFSGTWRYEGFWNFPGGEAYRVKIVERSFSEFVYGAA